MRFVLPFVALSVLLLVNPVWSGEDDPDAAARDRLRGQALDLIQQGSLDYERLKLALSELEAKKALLAAGGGSLQAMDQLARKARALNADISDLEKARVRLEDAKERLRTGRFQAALQTFNESAARWAAVHQRIVAHIGESPNARAMAPVTMPTSAPVRTAAGQLAALRQEILAMRAELQALRAEVGELKTLVQSLAR